MAMNGKLRVGVFGARRGMDMIRVLASHPDAELVAVCDKWKPYLENTAKVAAQHNIEVALFEKFEDFFKYDMDAVVLANYANEHAPYAIRFLKSGRHVLSEVLPTETMAEAVQLVEAVEESGKVYAFAENYCYMTPTFEMWRRYEQGDIGEITYGEGEYVHDAMDLLPVLTQGDPNHWRMWISPFYYCTHSLGPLLSISGHRPVEVTGICSGLNKDYERLGGIHVNNALEIVRLDNGAILKSMHGPLKRQPESFYFVVYGSDGMMTSDRYGDQFGGNVEVYMEREKLCDGTHEESYMPERFIVPEEAKKFPTHNGADIYPVHLFIEKILGRPNGKYSLDVYQALDMSMCGLMAHRSALAGGIPMKVPNFRIPEEREPFRNDYACTRAEVAGDQVQPVTPYGSRTFRPEVHEEIHRLFMEGKRMVNRPK